MSRKLDFDYTVDNLFGELSRLQEVNDTPEFRQPYQAITDIIENRLALEREQNENEIEDSKVNLRNQYLTLKRDRRETFLITTGFIFSRLVTLIGYNQTDEFRARCINEHEELETREINKLGIEFMEISRKPTKQRKSTDDDRKQEIVTQLMNMVPRRELNDMIDEGIKVERQVQEKERLAEQQQQRELAGPTSGNSGGDSREMKESKQQDSLGLPIPQAQRDNGQQR